MGVTVRRATAEDVATIAEFNIAMALETEGETLPSDVVFKGVAAAQVDSHRGSYYLAEVGGQIAGCLMVTREWSDWRNGWFLWIQSVYIDKPHRRKGVYRHLYEHLKDEAREDENIYGFRLYAESKNERAHECYRALGMTETRYRMFEEVIRDSPS